MQVLIPTVHTFNAKPQFCFENSCPKRTLFCNWWIQAKVPPPPSPLVKKGEENLQRRDGITTKVFLRFPWGETSLIQHLQEEE